MPSPSPSPFPFSLSTIRPGCWRRKKVYRQKMPTLHIFGKRPQCLVAAPSLFGAANPPQAPGVLDAWPCLASGALSARLAGVLYSNEKTNRA